MDSVTPTTAASVDLTPMDLNYQKVYYRKKVEVYKKFPVQYLLNDTESRSDLPSPDPNNYTFKLSDKPTSDYCDYVTHELKWSRSDTGKVKPYTSPDKIHWGFSARASTASLSTHNFDSTIRSQGKKPVSSLPPPLTEFSLFSELPTELQLMIWSKDLDNQGPRLIRPRVGQPGREPKWGQIPASLYACQQSRKEALSRGYKHVCGHRFSFYIMPSTDMIYIRGREDRWYGLLIEGLEGGEHIRHLAIDDT